MELKRREGASVRRVAQPDRRVPVGVFLLTFGILLSSVSYLIGIVPILALGLASCLIGIMTIYIPSPENSSAHLGTELSSLQNIENLLDDLDLDQKGIYIPFSDRGVSPKVFVPLALTPATIRPPVGLNHSSRIFVNVGKNPEDRGVLLEPPGKQILTATERALRVDIAKVPLDELGSILESGFRTLNLGRVTEFEPRESAVRISMELSTIEMDEKLRNATPRLSSQIGTPIVSAVAAAVTKAAKKYVTIKSAVLDPRKKKLDLNLRLYS